VRCRKRGVQPLGSKQLARLDVRIIAASNVPSRERCRQADSARMLTTVLTNS
jgi:DNA-binding NtrC family response regulator